VNGVVIGNVGEWFWDLATDNGLQAVREETFKA
jgi:hypothetical protein